jgi:hypothetical protein
VVSLEVVALAEGTTRCDAADVIADVARDMLLMYGEFEFTVADREDKMGYGGRRTMCFEVANRREWNTTSTLESRSQSELCMLTRLTSSNHIFQLYLLLPQSNQQPVPTIHAHEFVESHTES